MDDAIIKVNTAILDSVSPIFTGNGNGRDQNKPRLASPPVNCSMCGEPLIEHEFTKGFELTCDKVGCYMFRQPQGTRLKGPKAGADATSYHVRHDIGITTRKGREAQRQLELIWSRG